MIKTNNYLLPWFERLKITDKQRIFDRPIKNYKTSEIEEYNREETELNYLWTTSTISFRHQWYYKICFV